MNEDAKTGLAKLVVVHGEEQERMPKLVQLFSRRDRPIRDSRHEKESFQILETVTSFRFVPAMLVHHPVNDGVELIFHDEWKTDSPVRSPLYGIMLHCRLFCGCYCFHSLICFLVFG